MLILQILLVPIFVVILVSAVFIIGVASVTSSQNDNPNDYPIIYID